MSIIEALIPRAGQADSAGLRTVDPDVLAQYLINPAHPWWRRRPCAVAIAGHVPEARVPDLLARIRDPEDTAEVRIALLDAIGDRPELLPWLRNEDPSADKPGGLPHAVLKARGVLGDRSAAPALATLAHDQWPHHSALGEAGLDALCARYGAETIIADLGDTRPEDCAFRVRMRHRAGADVTEAFADPDTGVAYLAQSLADDKQKLIDYLSRAPTTDAKLWAAYALHRHGHDLAEVRAIYDSVGRPRVEIDGLGEEVRSAIMHQYPHGERLTDPRWKVAAICAEPLPPVDVDEQLARASAALAQAGLRPKPPISCGEFNGQGAGTYHIIAYSGGAVFVSTLGPFVTDDDCDDDEEALLAARNALEAAGLRWIDGAQGAVTVTGLCVYHFGDREPLEVRELLFYWQD